MSQRSTSTTTTSNVTPMPVSARSVWVCTSLTSPTSHPQCLSQYSQILKCAMSEAEVDSADMLRCCWDRGVSHHCDGWCLDLPEQVVGKENEEFCAISFSKQIIGCIDQQKQKKIGNTKTDNIVVPPNSKIEDIQVEDVKNETSSRNDNNSLLQTANERTDRNVNIGVAVFCFVSIGGKNCVIIHVINIIFCHFSNSRDYLPNPVQEKD